MTDIQFRQLDLNLLRVFDTLMQERSVSGASARLFVTPSAISHSLNKLRFAFKDELFLRVAQGMQPTPRAMEMAPRIRQALYQVQTALAPAEFQPQASERQFLVSASPYSAWLMVPPVTKLLHQGAPKAGLGVVSPGMGFDRMLDAGATDLAIAMPHYISSRHDSELLLRDTQVWVMRRALAPPGRLTLAALAAFGHVMVAPNRAAESPQDHGADPMMTMASGRPGLEAALKAGGLAHHLRVTVPDAPSALAAVGDSKMAALVPKRLAQAFAGVYDLAMFTPPHACPEIEFRLVWRRGHLADPAVAWLRTVFQAAAAELL